MLIVPGNFFGLGLHGYYSLEFSKKQRLLKRNDYNQKLQAKKDS